MDVLIQKADISDIDVLVSWRMRVIREVFDLSGQELPEGLEEENRNYYMRAIPEGKHIACFAVADGEIVGCGGMCLHQEMPSPDNPTGQCAYVMNVYCLPLFRRNGVGESVVRWLTDRAKGMRIPKIYLETSDIGRPLYERVGFCELPDMMIMPRYYEKEP